MHRWVAISTLCIWPILANSEITSATYEEPTDIYGHGAVANGEYAILSIGTDSSVFRIRYDGAVFEDTQPRLVDLNGDGAPEVVAVRSGFTTGASIVVFGLGDAGKIEELMRTEPIGQRNRWLAIAAIADLDQDGAIEIAYVDRPHLAKVLRVIEVASDLDGAWTYRQVAQSGDLTNHHYRAPDIEGGLRDCDGRLEIITADGSWSRIVSTSLEEGELISRDLGIYQGAASLEAAMSCN